MSSKKEKVSMSKEAIKCIISSKDEILTCLKSIVEGKSFNYRTFGTAIEDHISDAIVKMLTKQGIVRSKDDYIAAPDKNHFPDLELKGDTSLAIEFKSGNICQKRKGKWVLVKNSENDMGTLNKWPHKIQKYGGENIYYVFVLYHFSNSANDVLKVDIAPFYQFLGLNNDGYLKYREKDGNLRPKNFDDTPPIRSLKQFEQLLGKTIIYRSKRIIKKHKQIIRNTLKLLE